VRLSAPRWIERLLFLTGIVCLGIWVYAFLDARLYEMRQERRLEEAIRQREAAAARTATPAPAAETDTLETFRRPATTADERETRKEDEDQLPELASGDLGDLGEGDLIGRIKIRRIGVSALILQGVGNQTLRRGVGHVPGTPLPERGGNVGLAGHRDSFFRGLKDIRKDDTIELTTLDGTFEYQVDWTEVVSPEDTGVLADEGAPALTLVTCYPFHYVGSAPKRFIVRAHRTEGT